MSDAERLHAMALLIRASADDPDKVRDLASLLAGVLAVRLHQMEGALVPPHLREVPAALPAGVARLPARRARA